MFNNAVFHREQCAVIVHQLGNAGFQSKAFMKLCREYDRGERGKTEGHKAVRDAPALKAGDLADHAAELFLQHIERTGTLSVFIVTESRFRQSAPVNLTVRVQWDPVDLHRHRRYHILRQLVGDEFV